MKIKLRALGLLLVLPLGLQAADPAKPAKITYDEHVLPILREHCIACHNQDKKKGGLTLNTFTALMEGGSSGAAVKPGDASNSLLFRVMAHLQEPFMPPSKPKLPEANLAMIQKWIEGGALENAGSKAVTGTKPKTDIGLTSIIRGKPEGPPPMPPTTLALAPVVQVQRPTAVTAIASSPWAPLVAVAGQKQVFLYHSDTLDLLGVLPFPEGVPHVLKFSRAGGLLLAGGGRGGKSGKVVVWKVTTGERVIEIGDETDAVLAADISPDQTQIALGGPSKVVRIYSTKDGKLLQEIRKHTDWIYALEFSPDGVLLASGDRNGGLFVWEAFTAREYFSLRGHTKAITAVSWRNDSNVLASASEDTTIRLWEMENGNPIKNWGAHGEGAEFVQFARDNRLVSTGRDRLTKVWDSNGAQQRVFEAFPDVGLRATFSHDGARVIGGDWSGKINVWAMADGKLVGNLSANPPSLAEQFEAAAKELVARVAARDAVLATAKASRAAADKAAADLAAAQKMAADSQAAIKAAADALVQAQAKLNQANATVQQAQAEVAAKELLVKALTEAATKVKTEADKKKDDKALAGAAARAAEIANQAAAELTAAQKNVTTAMAGQKLATDQLAVAQKNDMTARANAVNAPKEIAARTATARTTADKAKADQVALDQANAAVKAAADKVDRTKAALANERK